MAKKRTRDNVTKAKPKRVEVEPEVSDADVEDQEEEIVREELSENGEDDIGNEDVLGETVDSGDDEEVVDDEEDDQNARGDDGDDDDESSGGEGEEVENRLNAVGSAKFANALKSILGADGEEITSEPAKLFQRKTKIMKLEETEKIEKRKQKKVAEEKLRFDMKSVIKLPEKDPSRINRERDLKRIATRGVVALFNAIGTHQRSGPNPSAAVKNESKESFLELLKQKATGKAASSAPAKDESSGDEDIVPETSGWKVLQEDYLENPDEVESEDEEEERADIEDDDESD